MSNNWSSQTIKKKKKEQQQIIQIPWYNGIKKKLSLLKRIFRGNGKNWRRKYVS